MSAIVVSVLTIKGGQTKTTTAVNVARGLRKLGATVQGLDLNREQANFASFDDTLEGVKIRLSTAGRIARMRARAATQYIIVDNPPSVAKDPIIALLNSDLVIAPIVPEALAATGLEGLMQVVEAIRDPERQANPNLKFRILISKHEPKDPNFAAEEKRIRDEFGNLVWPDTILRTPIVNESIYKGQSILDYAPRTEPARIYRAISSYIFGEFPPHG